MILTLIGYRATGKTTLARLVAERLGWDWIDADVEIERRAGKSIARIFAEQGEPAFRDLEAGIIPSGRTGGSGGRRRSAVAVGESPGDARPGGWWLSARPGHLARMSSDATTTTRRPILPTKPLEEIIHLLEVRTPIYQSQPICGWIPMGGRRRWLRKSLQNCKCKIW